MRLCNFYTIGFLSIFLFFITSCRHETAYKAKTAQVDVDLAQIKERGVLKAITGYSPTSYYIYKGQPMGHEYELLKRFAKHLGVRLEIVVSSDLEQVFDMLQRGEGDVIAHNLTVTSEREQWVSFSDPHRITQQVLVQRKPTNWRSLSQAQLEKSLIRNPVKLIGQPVHVHRGSVFFNRLQELSGEVGGEILAMPVGGDVEVHSMIEDVANGKIDFTMADRHVAEISATYYSNIDVKTTLSLQQDVAWAVRFTSPELLGAINQWLAKEQKGNEFHSLFDKYYKNSKNFALRASSPYSSLAGSHLSPYDALLKKYADKLGWDWRLLASMAFQESKFDTLAGSWAGAVGLMQVLPSTAAGFGVTDLENPEENLKACTAYIKSLYKFWDSIPDPEERTKFVLASYNTGPGHVADARRIAVKLGKNPYKWENNVESCIRLLSDHAYYSDPLVYYGYCRGEEPYIYVRDVMDRFYQYRILIGKDAPNSGSWASTIERANDNS